MANRNTETIQSSDVLFTLPSDAGATRIALDFNITAAALSAQAQQNESVARVRVYVDPRSDSCGDACVL